MADISAVAADEIAMLSDATGFAQWEFEQFWTQELFDATLSQFRAGLITEPIVQIEQAGVPPSEVFITTFIEGVKADLDVLGDTTKLVLTAAVIIGALILLTKVGV